MNYTYKLIRQTDGTLLVTVQPLMQDIENSIKQMMEIDVSALSKDDKQVFDLKILGLKTVYEFLGSLVQEQVLKDASAELKGTVTLDTGDTLRSIN